MWPPLGAIVAAFSLAPFIGLAFVGAAAFGAAAAWTLASGMGALQSRLEGNERVLAFSAFHVVIRCGLAVAAIGAGVAGELVDGVRLADRRHARAGAIGPVLGGHPGPAQRDAGTGAHRGRRVTVAIVTDSAAALPTDVVDALGVTVVPMWLQLDGAARHEDEVDLDELIVHRDISTSGPTPGEFEAVLRDRATDDGVCLLTISATMSSTYEAAVLGAELVGRELGTDRVRVVDTRTAAGAQGLVVIAAARAAARGATLDEVEAVARAAMNEVRLVACVPDLGYLVRSGRVPNIAGWAGRRLGLTPLFEFREGGAHPLRPARGMDNALERIVARCRRGARRRSPTAGRRPARARTRYRDGSAEPGREGAGPERDRSSPRSAR